MMTLYVVMGTTGEYSDRSEWPVRAFIDEKAAETFVTDAEQWLREHSLAHGDDVAYPAYGEREAIAASCPFDPGLQTDYTGTSYYFMLVPLDDAVRQDIAETVVADINAGKLPRRGMKLQGAL